MEPSERQVVERVTTRRGEFQMVSLPEGETCHYELIFNGVFLMATYNAPSSRKLADAALAGVASRRNLDFLIGGLGMGFALRQALTYAGIGKVFVVELEPKIVLWNRKYLGNSDILDDPRTELVLGDFCDYVQGQARSYHGIALDIDNGPGWVVRGENRRVYSLSMLEVLKNRLRSDGALAVWTHAPVVSYERALREVFSEVRQLPACDREPGGRSIESTIYVARA